MLAGMLMFVHSIIVSAGLEQCRISKPLVLHLQAEPTVFNDELDEGDAEGEEELDVDEEFKRYSSASQSLSSIFTGEEEVLKVDPAQADESLLVSFRPWCVHRAIVSDSLLVHSSIWSSNTDAVRGTA